MTRCPDCGTRLDDVPVGDPCPDCGGTWRSAEVLPDPIRVDVTVPPPTVFAESNHPNGEQKTVLGYPGGRSVTTNVAGHHTQSYEGKPSQGESNVRDVLHRLADTLNEMAGSRVWRERFDHEHPAVDGSLISTDGRELQCQVTRVLPQELQEERGIQGSARRHADDQALADDLVAAVESKNDRADPRVALVLDTIHAPAYTDPPRIIEVAEAELSERGYLDRWAQVWLAGPTTARTKRLRSP